MGSFLKEESNPWFCPTLRDFTDISIVNLRFYNLTSPPELIISTISIAWIFLMLGPYCDVVGGTSPNIPR